MGPWFIRDDAHPYRPGCSLETMRDLIARGRITGETIIRGPTTNQFWNLAKRTPGLAHLLGHCHNCRADAGPEEILCSTCGASFGAVGDRQHLGLLPVALLPGRSPAPIIAATIQDWEGGDPGPRQEAPVAPPQMQRSPRFAPSKPAKQGWKPTVALPVMIGLLVLAAAGGYLLQRSGPPSPGPAKGQRIAAEERSAATPPATSRTEPAQNPPIEPAVPASGGSVAVESPGWEDGLYADSEQSLGTVLDFLRKEARSQLQGESERGDLSGSGVEASISTVERRIELHEFAVLP